MHTKSGKLEREKMESTVHKMPENNRRNNKKRMHWFFFYLSHTQNTLLKLLLLLLVDYIVAIWLVKNRQKKRPNGTYIGQTTRQENKKI